MKLKRNGAFVWIGLVTLALSFWGREGDQNDIEPVTKPNPRDKNVMPYELVDFIEAETSFKAMFRVGGETEFLKRFLSAGLPVIIEKGFEGPNFDSGRYQDVIDLETKTLDNMGEPVLEESYYWRAMAREAMGDVDGAIADLQTSLEYHTGFEPSLALLQRLGISAPPSH